jgi:hypothetical protein
MVLSNSWLRYYLDYTHTTLLSHVCEYVLHISYHTVLSVRCTLQKPALGHSGINCELTAALLSLYQ